MISRRTRFAVPVVLVVGAGCRQNYYPPNPPPPTHYTAEQCRALTEGAACKGVSDNAGDRDPAFCSVEPADATCGLLGYECRATEANVYAWRAVTKPDCAATTAPAPAE